MLERDAKKGQRIALGDTRRKKRAPVTSVEQKKWFWPAMWLFSFLGIGGGVAWIANGGNFYEPTTPAVSSGIIAGIMALFSCRAVQKQRRYEFELMRANRKIANTERELERFIIIILRAIRLPAHNVRNSGKKLAKDCRELSDTLKQIDIPENLRKKIETITGNSKTTDTENKRLSILNKKLNITGQGSIITSAKSVWRDAGRLDSMAAALLKLGKIRKTTPLDESAQWLDMNSIVVKIARKLNDDIKKHAAKVKMKDLPCCIGDKTLIEQAFTELIKNAVRYLAQGRPGEIKIWGWQERKLSYYCIEDNGVGIQNDEIEKIFEVFYCGHPDRVISEGIGLAIVRRIVERHNGRIWVKSKINKGSTFTIAIPAK
jgi:signal transduction histidine kinase